tara:strand:+ start:667 stop:1389 length:723 start_codon:yes stop_codon:yes gene_type:complete
MYKKNKIVAIITARGGSKGIKNKNLINLNGHPLISYTINYAKSSNLIDRTFVTTDSKNISSFSLKLKAEVIKRPRYLSGDYVINDLAVIHAINFIQKKLKYNFNYVVFLQPTTPMRKIGELDEAIKHCINKKFDTVFSSIDYKPFLWRKIKNKLKPITFEPKKRKRRQEITDINETGSYYITRKETFLKFKDRFGKKISNFNSEFHSFLEIDDQKDYNYIQQLLKTNIPNKNKIYIPKKL